jgi:hypothetical protein
MFESIWVSKFDKSLLECNIEKSSANNSSVFFFEEDKDNPLS